MSQSMQLFIPVWLPVIVLMVLVLPESIQIGSTDVYDQPYGHKYCNASTLESFDNCNLYRNQSVTFVCICADEQCSNTWKLWRRNNATVLNHTGQQYRANVLNDFNFDSITCENNNRTLYKWTITILQSAAPMFLVDLTENGYFVNDDVLSYTIEDNSTCLICINCSVTGSPVPTVTWSYQSDNSSFAPIITNDPKITSSLYLFDNNQKLCFSNIGNYLGHQYEYKCTAVNAVGNKSAIFSFDGGDTLDFLRPGKLASKLQTYIIDEGANVSLVMDTDYFEEVAFRACRYDSSSSNQSVTCCDCSRSVKCEWGVLNNSSSPQPVCHLWTSQLGLYQFLVYTSQFPCYQNIGSPFTIQLENSFSVADEERFVSSFVTVVIMTIITMVTIMVMTATIIIYIIIRKYRRQRDDNDDSEHMPLTTISDDLEGETSFFGHQETDDNSKQRALISTILVKNEEICPLRNSQIISRIFDYNGGELLIKEHAVKVTVPIGAIDENYEVQIEAAASLFGPFIIPEDYCPISAYVWIGTCYEFKKKLIIEMEHDIVGSEEANISEFCVLTACEEDKCDGENNQILYKMHEDTCEYHCELNKTTCTIFTSHFCSICLAAKKTEAKKARRIVMYHYLPENYKSEDEFVAEVCLCYDLQFCKERTEQRYAKRRMEQESSTSVYIFNWEEDKFLLRYPEKVENWEICHTGYDEIIAEEVNFRLFYDNVDDLLRDEESDQFPPRFKLKIVQKDYNLSTLLYKYEIYVQSKRNVYLTLSISGLGQQFLRRASTHQQQLLVVDMHQHHSTLTSSSLQQCYTAINQQQSQALLPLSQPLTAPISQQQLQPGSLYVLKVDQDQTATSRELSTESQGSQERACFGNPQQLKSAALQTTDQTTNVTYNIFTKGDNNTISLASSDGPPTVKTKFNSLQPYANEIAYSVNVDAILPTMTTEGLVTTDQQQDLINPSIPKKQQMLYDIILRLPENCVNKFLHCLLETNNYEPHKKLYDKLCKHIATSV